MCENCSGFPLCACRCVFVNETDLTATVFVGFPIEAAICRTCLHSPVDPRWRPADAAKERGA